MRSAVISFIKVWLAEYLRLDFDIVDVNGTAVFYLVQRPLILLAWDFPPSSSQQLAAVAEPHSSR